VQLAVLRRNIAIEEMNVRKANAAKNELRKQIDQKIDKYSQSFVFVFLHTQGELTPLLWSVKPRLYRVAAMLRNKEATAALFLRMFTFGKMPRAPCWRLSSVVGTSVPDLRRICGWPVTTL